MVRTNARVPASLLAVALSVVVLSAGDCPVDPPAQRTPPPNAAGTWYGEVLGVRLHLSVFQQGTAEPYLNLVSLGGTGWLIYGTPTDSVMVAIGGLNAGDPPASVSLHFVLPGGGGDYGDIGAVWQTDGTLLGTLSRMPDIEPSPSPWPAVWPAGAQSVPLRLTRQ